MRRGVYCYGRPPASPEDCLCPQTPERTEPWLNEGAQVGRGTGSRLPDGLRDIGARRRYEEVPQVEGPHGPPRGKEEHSVTALIGLRAHQHQGIQGPSELERYLERLEQGDTLAVRKLDEPDCKTCALLHLLHYLKVSPSSDFRRLTGG